MKMTPAQLRTWSETAIFTAADHLDGETLVEVPAGITDDGEDIMKSITQAYAWRTLSAALPDGSIAEITYQEEIEWDVSHAGRIKEDYRPSPMSNAATWILDGVTLVDDDGDALENWETQEEVEKIFGHDSFNAGEIENASQIDYAALLPPVQTEDIDIKEGDSMEIITVERDNDADIRFNGEQIAQASSHGERSNGRWTVLKLFKTAGGRFVCQSIGVTQWQGEDDRSAAQVCENETEVIAFFKHGRVAKDLYHAAGIEDVKEID